MVQVFPTSSEEATKISVLCPNAASPFVGVQSWNVTKIRPLNRPSRATAIRGKSLLTVRLYAAGGNGACEQIDAIVRRGPKVAPRSVDTLNAIVARPRPRGGPPNIGACQPRSQATNSSPLGPTAGAEP